jgi:uncharacterized membrane protein HdeD (DUF308 family)
MKLAGIILIVLGVLACVYQFVPVTQEHQDAKIGSLTIQHQETHYYPVTIAGVVLIVGGVGCLFAGGRR